MPQVFAIKIFKELGLKELTLHSWRSRQGIAILWIIAIIMAFATLGSAMVATYNVSLFGQVETGLSLAAESMAESGYRFLFSEYQNQAGDVGKNELLDEIRFVDDASGKIFNISPDGGGQFQLEMTSYFYRVQTDPNGTKSLELKFIGNEGFNVPEAGTNSDFLRIHNDDNIYEYSDKAYDPDTKIYTFTLTSIVQQSAAEYTTVRPVVLANISSVAENGTLTLASGQGSLFPPGNGMFLITKQKIKANLPVKTIVPYRYKYRNGDQLINVQKVPHQSSFTTIDGGSTKIEVAKFLSVDSIGFAPDKASALASETNAFQLSLDISASTPGLKSYWSFDDATEPAEDDYGTSEGTLSGTGVTHTTTGKVGGGLKFDATKTGYVSTTFNPSIKIGSNREFTIVFWAKPGSDITTEQGVVGVSKTDQNFYIGIINGYWEWGLGTQNDSDSGDGSKGLPEAIADQWQHVAFVYDGSDVILYVNGIEEYRKEHTGVATMPNENIYLGALYDPDTGNHILGFTGSLDEIAVFNTALNFGEVNTIFHVPDTVPCNIGCDAKIYYNFSGDANDKSGSNWDGLPTPVYNGTVSGATLTEDQGGYADQAYYFDGSDYIDTSFNARSVIGDGNPFTLAFWAKPAQVTLLQAAIGAFNEGQSRRFYVAVYNGEWLWGYGNIYGPLGSLPEAAADEWVHIGFVYDDASGKIRFYLNGVENIYDYTGDGVLPNFNVYVGARNRESGYDSKFIGIVDEVLIWNEAKTATYILDLYNGTNP